MTDFRDHILSQPKEPTVTIEHRFRYLAFAGQHYYPHGGWEDFKGSAGDLHGARALCDEHENGRYTHEWAHIVDMTTGKIVIERAGDQVGFDEWEDKEE